MKSERARWFRIHLRTAVLLMIAASVLLMLNMRSREKVYDYKGAELRKAILQGWPFTFTVDLGSDKDGRKVRAWSWEITGEADNSISRGAVRMVTASFDKGALLLNGLVGVLLLLGVAIGCEWWIRRRE